MNYESEVNRPRPNLMLKHVAVPIEHGSWVFLFSPLIIGLFAGKNFTAETILLIGAALSAFMVRQPLTILVKILSRRRPRTELPAVSLWGGIYSVMGLGFVTGLIIRGYHPILFLVVPALPVFAWHLWLVSRRSERRQPLVEIAGSGALALVAPAAYWVGIGHYDPLGWLLWGLCWLQAAVSIQYAYLRLEQRGWKAVPNRKELWITGRKTVLLAFFAVLLVAGLAFIDLVPRWLPLAFGLQWIETIWGTFFPAVKVKPAHIGIRQLIISTLFTIVFILTW